MTGKSFLFWRKIAHILVRLFYSVKVKNIEKIPSVGGGLIVANHLSFIDVLFLAFAVKRRVRFVTSWKIYYLKWLHPICKAAGAFPLSPKDPPKRMLQTLENIRQAIKEGWLVCMFPEGDLSRTGNTLKFNRGIEFIMKGLAEPIIPAYLDRTWGSMWGYDGGKYFLKKPRRFRHPVTVVFGDPMSSDTKAFDVRGKVLELGVDAFGERLKELKTLPEMFFDQVRKKPFLKCMADTIIEKQFNRMETFIGAWALSRVLLKKIKKEEIVGVFLPTSIGGSLVNMALSILNKVVVNLNYTTSKESLASAVDQTQMKYCITSRKFLDKVQTAPPCEPLFLEDLVLLINPMEKIFGFFLVLVMPYFLAHRIIFGSWKSRNNQSLATIVFTSGSTGLPKGVMLSHANIIANIEGIKQALHILPSDSMMGILPFFHSFGFTAVLWLPMITHVSVVYHPNPLDAQMIGELVRKHQLTFLLATPTFLSAYTKRCQTEDFKSIRFTVIGAEKLKKTTAEAFEKKFGFMPLEGYGCTELSPIVSLNFPDYQAEDMVQKANKFGTIGNPLPGIAVRVVHPDTGEILAPYTEGMLMVKGQNVMKGYWKQPEKTQEVLQNGWYKTGDIAFLDRDGFVTITDRLNRFSKIGGEMVPHVRIEEAIQHVLKENEQRCWVVGVSDEKKGEKLVVLYTGELDKTAICLGLKIQGLPNLWIPQQDSFYQIEAVPVLGSGKLDLAGLKKIAQQMIDV